MMLDVQELLLDDGSSPYGNWFDRLPAEAAARVSTALIRLQNGNTSKVKWFRGIGEYKIDHGPGWRIYLAKDGIELVILLGGGNKQTQHEDIEQALALWGVYKKRKAEAKKSPRTRTE